MHPVTDKEMDPCKCGGKARYRYRIPCHWIECRKCGLSTGYYADKTEHHDPVTAKEVVEAWNRMVRK